MSSFILAALLAAVAVTVLAYLKRHSLPLWLAAMFAWVLVIRFGVAQLAGLVPGGWSSLFGA